MELNVGPHDHLDRVGIASSSAASRGSRRTSAEGLDRDPGGIPSVAIPGDTTHRRRCVRREVQRRMGTLQRLEVDATGRDVMVDAVDVDDVVGPRGDHRRDHFIHTAPAVAARDARREVLVARPTGAETDLQSSTAEYVDPRQVPGEDDGLIPRGGEHARTEGDPFGVGRSPGERREGSRTRWNGSGSEPFTEAGYGSAGVSGASRRSRTQRPSKPRSSARRALRAIASGPAIVPVWGGSGRASWRPQFTRVVSSAMSSRWARVM